MVQVWLRAHRKKMADAEGNFNRTKELIEKMYGKEYVSTSSL